MRIKTVIFCVLAFLGLATGCESESDTAEVNRAEEMMLENNNWPKKLTGNVDVLDSGSYEGDFAYWAIAIFEVSDPPGDILIEFRGDILKKAGIDSNFEFTNPVSITVNQAVEEYYQVVSISK